MWDIITLGEKDNQFYQLIYNGHTVNYYTSRKAALLAIADLLGKVSNNRGNSLLQCLMGMVLVGIMTMAMSSLMVASIKQQVAIQQQNLMTNVDVNLRATIGNAGSCVGLFSSVNKLTTSATAIPFAGTNALGYQLKFNANVVAIGPEIAGTLSIWQQDGKSNNYKLNAVNGFNQQAQITTTFVTPVRTWTKKYLVNVFVDSNNKVIGCVL